MSTITRRVYDVYLNPDGLDLAADPFNTEGITCHRVVVTHADQLRGELEAAKRGVDLSLAQNVTSIFVWASLVRHGFYDRKYDAFRAADCADIKSPTPPGPEGEETVPPTGEPSGSVSPSPRASRRSSTTGYTPTSTNVCFPPADPS